MRIGIIGGGQLGQMLGFAGKELGLECEFLDPSPTAPAADAGPVTAAAFDDEAAIRALAGRVDVLTYEFENVPVPSLETAAGETPVYPPLGALASAQDRLHEKRLFASLGIPLPGWHAVDTRDDLDDAAARLAYPIVLKTRRLGYDGKGQFVIREAGDLDTAWSTLGGTPLIAEAWVPFDYEVSAIAARSVDGAIEHYPLTNNFNGGGILRYSRDQQRRAEALDAHLTEMVQLESDESDAALQRLAELSMRIELEQRVFDDREKSIPFLCTRPRVIEQRIGELARAISSQLD